jgi:hypothetical protein
VVGIRWERKERDAARRPASVFPGHLAHDALPAAAARVAFLIDNMIRLGLHPTLIAYEFDSGTRFTFVFALKHSSKLNLAMAGRPAGDGAEEIQPPARGGPTLFPSAPCRPPRSHWPIRLR